MSSVVPIPKTPTNSENPSNYQLISLLSVVSKLLEKHIYGLVFEHMVDRNMLSQLRPMGFYSREVHSNSVNLHILQNPPKHG